MPPFSFDAHPVRLPAQFVPCNVPHWPAVAVANTTASEDLRGVAFDGRGGAFVLTIELAAPVVQTAVRLTYVTPAGVRRTIVDVHRAMLSAGTQVHLYYAAIAPLGVGRCAVVWGELNGPLTVEGFDDTGASLFSSQVAPPMSVPRLAAIAPRGNGVAVAFFHAVSQNNQWRRVLRVRLVGATGAISGTAEWAAAVTGFNDFRFPQIATSDAGEFMVMWEENPSIAPGLPVFSQRLDSSAQTIGSAFRVIGTEDSWNSSAVCRAVADGDGGAYVGSCDPAGRLILTHVIRPSVGQQLVSFQSLQLSTLANVSAFSMAPDRDTGAVLVASIDAAGWLGARRIDPQGNDPWFTLARDVSGLAIQLMAGASSEFFAHATAIAANSTGGAVVVYHDALPSSSSTDVRTALFYACIEPTGRVQKRREVIRASVIPSQTLAVAADENAAVVAWRDRATVTSDTNVFAEKIECCEGFLPAVYPWPPRPFRGMALDFPLLPQHLPIALPARRGKYGYYGFLGVPQLAGIPGIALPGGLMTPNMPRPDWVRLSFLDLPHDFTIELFTHRGQSVARAKPLQILSEGSAFAPLSKQITFRPTHAGVYILGFGYEGPDFDPGERHLVRVQIQFGDSPSPARNRRSKRRGSRRRSSRAKRR